MWNDAVHEWLGLWKNVQFGTPWKTNMQPENGHLEKEIPDLETIIIIIHFQVSF